MYLEPRSVHLNEITYRIFLRQSISSISGCYKRLTIYHRGKLLLVSVASWPTCNTLPDNRLEMSIASFIILANIIVSYCQIFMSQTHSSKGVGLF